MYTYVANNPTAWVDTSGHNASAEKAAIIAIVIASIGGLRGLGLTIAAVFLAFACALDPDCLEQQQRNVEDIDWLGSPNYDILLRSSPTYPIYILAGMTFAITWMMSPTYPVNVGKGGPIIPIPIGSSQTRPIYKPQTQTVDKPIVYIPPLEFYVGYDPTPDPPKDQKPKPTETPPPPPPPPPLPDDDEEVGRNIFYPGSDMPNTTRHIDYAINVELQLERLHALPKGTSHDRNWYNSDSRCINRKPGEVCDEYPFASTVEGGQQNAPSLYLAPRSEQSLQGAKVRWFYAHCQIAQNGSDSDIKNAFLVVPRYDRPTGYDCANGIKI